MPYETDTAGKIKTHPYELAMQRISTLESIVKAKDKDIIDWMGKAILLGGEQEKLKEQIAALTADLEIHLPELRLAFEEVVLEEKEQEYKSLLEHHVVQTKEFKEQIATLTAENEHMKLLIQQREDYLCGKDKSGRKEIKT